jgi:hypothetical protein
MNWRKLIGDMLDKGETEASIAEKLKRRGIQCTQTTVNRLKSGFISEPRHSVGEALRALHTDVMKRAA